MAETQSSPKTFALVHGAWHGAWCWDKVRPHLEAAGHNTLAVNLPIEDPSADFDDYASVVVDSLEGPEDIILVGHSRGGNVIPRVANRTPIKKLIYLCSPVPQFEDVTPSDVLSHAPRRNTAEFVRGIESIGEDMTRFNKQVAGNVFYHDCTPETRAWAVQQLRIQRRISNADAKPIPRPEVAASYILCQDDRVITPEWSRYIAHQILDVTPIELPGGHSPFLSRPQLLAQTLLSTTYQA